MSLQKTNTRTIVLIFIIIAITIIRLLTYKYQAMSNFTPVGAVAIFGGVYFTDKWKAYLVVLLTLILSEVVINHFYTSQWVLMNRDSFWMCLCFSIIVFAGTLIKKMNVATALLVLLAPVLIHWLIMELPWVYSTSLYPKTLAGYGEALIAAIPFEKNMLLGDLVFGFVLFGGFELAQNKYTVLRSNKKLAV
jgi:hypothetical protein